MWLFNVRGRGWALQPHGGAPLPPSQAVSSPALFELHSDWLDLADSSPVLGPRIEGDIVLDAPVRPSKVVCIGLNFARHAEEQGKPVPKEPLFFLKPTTAIQHPDRGIELPVQSEEVHHEGELAVIIGRRLTRASEEEASAAIFGYTCANDITARDLQRADKRYTRAKGFDTFCPLGPAVRLADGFVPAEHTLEVRVNGELRQRSALDDFIFPIPRALAHISHVMSLLPGDVVLTGTPAGVGPLRAGDLVEVAIDGIGCLRNPVVRAPRTPE